jgi:hypothetical protein
VSANPTVTIKVPIAIPRTELDWLRAWLNTEHTGAATVAFDQTVSAALLNAHQRLNMTKEIVLMFEVDREGRLTLVNKPPAAPKQETP